MFGICLGYSNDYSTAKDILQEGFIKVFGNFKDYRKEGSLEGWIRRIIVNTAIDHYRKSVRTFKTIELEDQAVEPMDSNVVEKLNTEDLLKLINQMPEGYRIVFNLYVVEGYSHREIAEQLQISEGTSKSQLARAKKFLQQRLAGKVEKSTTSVIEESNGESRSIAQLV